MTCATNQNSLARSVPHAVVLALCILGFGFLLVPSLGSQSPGSCGLTSPAFCDTFDEGPAGNRGRGGDLDPTRWSAARLAPSDLSGLGPVANPARSGPIPPCKASFNVATVYPDNDTLICDPSGSRSAQLMTAAIMQNYGNNSYLIRQPFDFANRTGKIVFDVDAVSVNGLASGTSSSTSPRTQRRHRRSRNISTGRQARFPEAV